MTKVASSTLSRKKEVWMDTSKRSGLASWSSAVFLLAACAIVALPLIAEAQQNSCNGSFQINYVAPTPNFPNINDTVRVQLTIGAGTIQGGTQLTLTQLRFDNACKPTGTLGSCATTDADPGAGAGGPPVSYAGDSTIASTCAGVTWASNNSGGGVSPNQVIFTPTPALVIPAGSTNFCTLTFSTTVKNFSGNADPNTIIELAGTIQTSTSTGDATCNNGLSAGNSVTGTYGLCPACSVANECNTAACDNSTGQCVQTPKAPSTACTDTDGNNCTIAGCETVSGVGQCVQAHSSTTCTPVNECNTAACDNTGTCIQTPKAPSTACTDTDGNLCTVAGCETVEGIGQCVQTHASQVCVPSITTSQNPFTGKVGDTLNDSATLTGTAQLGTTNIVTFQLFGPADPTCSGTPLFTAVVPVTSVPSTVSTTSAGAVTTGSNVVTTNGVFRWTAIFSVDGVAQATSSCTEGVTIAGPVIPTLSEWGMGLMVLILVGTGFLMLRRRKDDSSPDDPAAA